MKKIAVIPAVLSVLVLAAAFPMAFATHSTPLNGSMSGTGVATSQTTNSITATGHLTHLGRLTLVGTTSVTGRSDCGGLVGTEQDAITSRMATRYSSPETVSPVRSPVAP